MNDRLRYRQADAAPLAGGDKPRRSLGERAFQVMLLTVIMLVSLGLYLVVLKWRGNAARLTTYTPWDEIVPFQPAWVWVYLLPYVIGPLTIAFLTWETCLWYVTRGLAIVAITLVIFIVLPTQTRQRPATDNLSGLTGMLYHQMIEIDDPPANAAPSLHVSLTLLLALALGRDLPRWWPVIVVGVGLVWLSTLATRQHHLIDVATGALLTGAVVLLWPRRKTFDSTQRANVPRSPIDSENPADAL
jgi:membrane-associated phospholipid phosphatase